MVLLHFDTLQDEGVAYRGRVLVELSTQLDGKVDKNVDDISSDDILVAQVLYIPCVVLVIFTFFFLPLWFGILKVDALFKETFPCHLYLVLDLYFVLERVTFN